MTPHRAERTALVFEDEEYSYARLDALAAGLAAALAARGVKAGDRVALMSANRPEWVVAVQAIWRLGASVVLFSPAWKQTETEHALKITEPAHAVGDHPVLAGLMDMLDLNDPIDPAVSTGAVAAPDVPVNQPDAVDRDVDGPAVVLEEQEVLLDAAHVQRLQAPVAAHAVLLVNHHLPLGDLAEVAQARCVPCGA